MTREDEVCRDGICVDKYVHDSVADIVLPVPDIVCSYSVRYNPCILVTRRVSKLHGVP